MSKKIKKICTAALAIAITAASAMSMSLSADCSDFTSRFIDFSDYTEIDDKGMLNHDGEGHEGYKLLYQDGNLFRAEPQFGFSKFVLSDDVDYEEANERIIEIFKEFYPDNYLDVSLDGMDYLEYSKNYKPNLWSKTEDGVTTYIFCANNRHICSLEDEKVATARKYSMAFMKKLNEEKLISAFYDFGEVYYVSSSNNMVYYYNKDIDLINNYIKENNIDCTLEEDDDYCYRLKSSDDDILENFLIAADIYEATSIEIEPINFEEPLPLYSAYGKNALEDVTTVDTPTTSITITTTVTGDANEDETTDIRDAAFIAKKVAQRKTEELPEWSDYNNDGKLDILDAAAIAKDVAGRILK